MRGAEQIDKVPIARTSVHVAAATCSDQKLRTAVLHSIYLLPRPRAPRPAWNVSVEREFADDCEPPGELFTMTVSTDAALPDVQTQPTAAKGPSVQRDRRAAIETARVLDAELSARISGEVRFDRT